MFSSLNSDLRKAWKISVPSGSKRGRVRHGAAEHWQQKAGQKKSEEPFHLHLEASSLSRESDHWDISSTQSLWETMASFKSNYKVWPRSRHTKTPDAFTYSSAMGGWHDLSRDLRLHLLGRTKKRLSWGPPMIYLLSTEQMKNSQILPFFFHLLVKCSHVERLQLPQRWSDKFKHCDSKQGELRSEVWSKLSHPFIYMCTRSLRRHSIVLG